MVYMLDIVWDVCVCVVRVCVVWMGYGVCAVYVYGACMGCVVCVHISMFCI